MKQFDVIIVGAGASGTMCALSAPKDKKIAIIDNLSYPAKKLLVTGNGRCNISNVGIMTNKYNQDIYKYFNKFNNANTLEFFEEMGLMVYADDEFRVYPFSNTAKSVVDVMFNQLKKRNVFLFAEQSVIKISRVNNQYYVQTENDEFCSKKVVVATGPQKDMGFLSDFEKRKKCLLI